MAENESMYVHKRNLKLPYVSTFVYQDRRRMNQVFDTHELLWCAADRIRLCKNSDRSETTKKQMPLRKVPKSTVENARLTKTSIRLIHLQTTPSRSLLTLFTSAA
jgi:hypothetical protein